MSQRLASTVGDLLELLPEIIVDDRVVGLKPERIFEMRDRFGHAGRIPCYQITQVVVRLGVVRLEPQGRFKVFGGLRRSIWFAGEKIREVEMNLRVGRLQS